MSLDVGYPAVNAAIEALLGRMGTPDERESMLGSAGPRISQSVFHDFAGYQFLTEPVRQRFPQSPTQSPTIDVHGTGTTLETWLEFEEFVSKFDTVLQVRVEEILPDPGASDPVFGSSGETTRSMATQNWTSRLIDMTLAAADGFRTGMAADLYADYKSTPEQEAYIAAAQEAVDGWMRSERDALVGSSGVMS